MSTQCGAIDTTVTPEYIPDRIVSMTPANAQTEPSQLADGFGSDSSILESFLTDAKTEEQLQFQISYVEKRMIEFDHTSMKFVDTFTSGGVYNDVQITPEQKTDAIALLCECENIVYDYRQILNKLSHIDLTSFPDILELDTYLRMLDDTIDPSLSKWNEELFNVPDCSDLHQVAIDYDDFESKLSVDNAILTLDSGKLLTENEKYHTASRVEVYKSRLDNIYNRVLRILWSDRIGIIAKRANDIKTRIDIRYVRMREWYDDLLPSLEDWDIENKIVSRL
jgi:hypothetical protein